MSKKDLLSLREVQLEELKLLRVFANFCEENRLRYSLQAGTLIGAVRHHGFIPWDDDIDVSMPRPDVDRLLEIAKEIPQGYALLKPEDSAFSYPFYKFVNLSVMAQEPSYVGHLEEHLWVDIFPIDGAAGDPNIVLKNKIAMRRATRFAAWVATNPSIGPMYKRVIKHIAIPLLKLTNPKARMLHVANEIARHPGYENSDRVSSFMGGSRSGWTLSKSEYEHMEKMEFEGQQFSVMGCWEEYLRTCYGDYMKLPPESERFTHHLKAWYV